MNYEFKYHKSLEHLHVNCEKPRAYFVPHSSENGAVGGNRAESDRFISLCGDWDFRFYPNETYVDDFTSTDFTTEGFDKLTVPMSWQINYKKGYDTPNYTNVNYPFTVEAPCVPNDNPCGLYVRTVKLSEKDLDGKEMYINFEGVDSCFYLYVNDEFAAYSQVSHMTTEVNVTKYLKAGENSFKVLVFKWCDGSYLEDQDKFRFSGIFREVYLLAREKVHVSDIFVKTFINPSYTQSDLTVDLELTGSGYVEASLTDPKGTMLGTVKKNIDGSGTVEFIVAAPALWSDETPDLYTLVIKCGEEYCNT